MLVCLYEGEENPSLDYIPYISKELQIISPLAQSGLAFLGLGLVV